MWVNDNSLISNQVLRKAMLTVTSHTRSLLCFLLLSLRLIIAKWISIEFQNAPPWCFLAQTLISSKITSPLEMPQHFMKPMCKDGDVFPAHPTVEMGRFVGSVCWCGHKEPAKLLCLYNFFTRKVFLGKFSWRRLLLSVSSTLVSDVSTL